MKQQRTSIIWKIPKTVLEDIVKKSSSISSILREIGYPADKGGNFKTLYKRLKEDQIDYSHIPLGQNANRVIYRGGVKRFSLEKIMVKDSTFDRGNLKKRLIEENIIPYLCQMCGMKPEWQSKKLVLVLDHINGVCNDHRKENLRFLCPNCNSQTDTFCGKHKRTIKPKFCIDCGKPISRCKKTQRCQSCAAKFHNIPYKRFDVTKEKLIELVRTKPMTQLGKMFGVSDTAVKKRCKSMGIEIPPMRGYWRKLETGNF